MITKAAALGLYNGNQSRLAAALKITSSAVSQWAEDKPIPEVHELKLRYVLHPEAFASDPIPGDADVPMGEQKQVAA